MLKFSPLVVKVGFDTTDTLTLWWYVDTLALRKIKIQVQILLLENLQPADVDAHVAERRRFRSRRRRRRGRGRPKSTAFWVRRSGKSEGNSDFGIHEREDLVNDHPIYSECWIFGPQTTSGSFRHPCLFSKNMITIKNEEADHDTYVFLPSCAIFSR